MSSSSLKDEGKDELGPLHPITARRVKNLDEFITFGWFKPLPLSPFISILSRLQVHCHDFGGSRIFVPLNTFQYGLHGFLRLEDLIASKNQSAQYFLFLENIVKTN